MADFLKNHSWVIVSMSLVRLFAYIVFQIWLSKDHFIMAVFYLASAYGAIAPLLSGWLNLVCGGNKHLRAQGTSHDIDRIVRLHQAM